MIRFKYIIKARRNDYEQKSNKRDTGNRFYGVLPYHGTAPESTGSTYNTATVKAGSKMSRSYPQNTGYTLQNIREWS